MKKKIVKVTLRKTKRSPYKIKWTHFEYKPNSKQAKEMRELQEIEKRDNELTRSYLREVAAFLDGYKMAKAENEQSVPFTNAHVKAVRKAIGKLS